MCLYGQYSGATDSMLKRRLDLAHQEERDGQGFFFCKNGDDFLKLFKNKNFLEYASSRYTLEDYQKMTSKKNNSGITLGSLPKTVCQSRFAPKTKKKINVFFMQNFIRFTNVSAPGTFLGAAQKFRNGDPK